jgi:membrane protein implicated in regulation of membrane protease activity
MRTFKLIWIRMLVNGILGLRFNTFTHFGRAFIVCAWGGISLIEFAVGFIYLFNGNWPLSLFYFFFATLMTVNVFAAGSRNRDTDRRLRRFVEARFQSEQLLAWLTEVEENSRRPTRRTVRRAEDS